MPVIQMEKCPVCNWYPESLSCVGLELELAVPMWAGIPKLSNEHKIDPMSVMSHGAGKKLTKNLGHVGFPLRKKFLLITNSQ